MSEVKSKTPQDVVAVVTGIQIGEETKGATVEWLARELDAHTVIRNGGCQAGHHIMTADGREQMFSHFAASTFEGTQTYLRHMVIDPVLLFREAMELEEKGVDDPFSIITIDGENISITPFHGALSRFKEILRSEKKGTVGLGVGDAVKDAQQGEITIRAKDFLRGESELLAKVEAIRQRKIQQAIDLIMALGIEELPDEAMSEMKTLHNSDLVSIVVQSFHYLADLLKITDDEYLAEVLERPGNLVTEPSHGALLHPFSFAPHTTQVDPTSQELIAELRGSGKKRVIRIGVGRCYMTRHGAGPLVSFDRTMTDSIDETHNAANPWANEWLGEFRIGHYDLIATRYGLAIAGGTEAFDGFMMSYMDVLNKHDRWGVVEAYTFKGDDADLSDYFETNGDLITGIKLHPDTRDEAHYKHQLRLTGLLKKCSPVVSYLYPTEDKSLEEVFIEYVEEKTGVPIIATSHGPKAEDREKRPAWDRVFPTDEEKEFPDKGRVYRPLSVDLYYVGQESTDLPPEIANNPTLLKEAAQRRELNTLLAALFAKIPDPALSLAEAVEKGVITAAEVEDLYKKFAEFITADENHGRVILYLPTQLLPQIKAEGENTPESQQFTRAYKDAWIRLLHESEPRASYVDGDILEEGMGEPVRVRKAAHLLPDMLKHNIFNFSDVSMLLEISDEPELLTSLTEGLMVARDHALISDIEWDALAQLAVKKVEIAKVLVAPVQTKEQSRVEFSSALAAIEAKYIAGFKPTAIISPERAKWEKQVALEKATNEEALYQAQKVQSGERSIDEAIALHPLVGIKMITLMGKQQSKTSIEQARHFARQQKVTLEQQWQTQTAGIKDAVLTCLSHWRKLGVIDDDYLEAFGVTWPDLSQPFPLDLKKRQETDGAYALEAAQKIEEHPVLSQFLLPVIVEVGSRVKGQAGFDTDYDGGIVFKPETPWEKREEVLELLRREIPELDRIEKPLEFWLSRTERGYGLRIPPDIRTVVNPAQIHFLLNSIWTSRALEFQQIHNDLLLKYVDLSRFGEQKDDVRRQLLRQLELDMLQYRLLHKAYEKFYPKNSPESSAHSDVIDGNSVFWNPGYRRIATQLFLSRVFLPDLIT